MVREFFQQSDYVPKLSKVNGQINLFLPKRITSQPIKERHVIYSFSSKKLSIIEEENKIRMLDCDKYVAKCIILYDIIWKCQRQKIQKFISMYKENSLIENQDILKFLGIEGDIRATALVKIAQSIPTVSNEELIQRAKDERVEKGFKCLLNYLSGD